jgi:hypothetical protein
MSENPSSHPALQESAHATTELELGEVTRYEVARRLRGLFNPLCELVVVAQLEGATNHELAQTLPTYTLANPEAALFMPWDLLLGKDEVPVFDYDDAPEETSTAADAYVNDLYADFYETESGTRKHALMRGILLGRSASKIATLFTDRTSIEEDNFGLAEWKVYEDSVAQLPPKVRSLFSAFFSFRFSNTEKARDMNYLSCLGHIKRSKSVVYVSSFKGTADHLGSDVGAMITNIIIPVGEYGEDFAQQLAQTTGLIMDSCVSNPIAVASGETATRGNERLLRAYTARGHDSSTVSGESTATTLREGILSVGQVLAQLTSQKVDGFEDPLALLESVIAAGLVEKLTRSVSSGIIGPISLSGSYLRNIIEFNNDSLQLNPALKTTFELLRERQALESETNFSDKNTKGSKLTGTVCPVAGKNEGVRQVAEAFLSSLKAQT